MKPHLPLSSILEYLHLKYRVCKKVKHFLSDLSQTLKSIQRIEITDENFSTSRTVRTLVLPTKKPVIIIKGAQRGEFCLFC